MPPAGRYLLDTNILIALLAAEPPVTAALRAATAVFIPSIALGELFYGAAKFGAPRAEHSSRRSPERGCCGPAVWGRNGSPIRRTEGPRKVAGLPIPENDLWIAAVALEHDRDTHFAALPEITTIPWS